MMPAAREVMLAAITEEQWQGWVTSTATLFGWKTYHVYDSRRSHPGWPDLVMVRGPRIIFAEVKSEKGKVTQAQDAWLDALGVVAAACPDHVEVFLWRPSDRDEVEKVLAP